MTISIELTSKVKITDRGTTSVTFATTGHGITSKVFAVEVLPASADDHSAHYRFSHVCHPAELVELPEEETADYSYFRTDEIELIFDSPTPVDAVTSAIAADLKFLVRELNALTTIDDLEYSQVIS